jgi:hypothetical protein
LGGLVAAATAGVLFGFGVRSGDLFLRFNLTATPLLGRRAFAANGFDVLVTPVGLLVHVGWALLTGLLFSLLLERLRGVPSTVVAIGVAAMVMLLQGTITPWIGGSGPVQPLAIAQRIMVALTIALALAVGMRLALPRHDWS